MKSLEIRNPSAYLPALKFFRIKIPTHDTPEVFMPAYARQIPVQENQPRHSANLSQEITSQEEFFRRGSRYNLTAEQISAQRTQRLIDNLTLAVVDNLADSIEPFEVQPQSDSEQNEPDQDVTTHSTPLPKSGLRGFFRQNLPMKLMNSRITKYFSKLQIRPKVPTGDTYRSSGDFKIKSISPMDAKKISHLYSTTAKTYKDKLDGQAIDEHIINNLNKSEEINRYIEKIAELYSQKNSEKANASFYILKKKKDSDPFAIAVISDLEGVMNIRGIAIHPSALIARADSNKRNDIERQLGISIGKYDVKGLGTAISLLASIATSRKNKSIHSVVTNAVNPLSAKIFEKYVGGKT